MLLNELDRNICIYTDPRHKDFVYVNVFHCIAMYPRKIYFAIFFAIYGKFVEIIIFV